MRLKLTFNNGVELNLYPVESIRIVGHDINTDLYMLATNTFGNALVYQNNVKTFVVTPE